ncbi:MAG TPA: M23 family metallopeptidase [Puia sp.]|nr:M23 family metallopeptidase [Puia sp.]
MIRTLLVAASLLCILSSSAQIFPPADYPRGYFRDPLNIPMSLAANFGELRPNHYHMGLDIRTQKKENLPVLAAADGSIVKVVIEPFGFGQAIYLRHPNGFTTVYAHLNEFFPALSSYIHQQQYKMETWQGTFDIPPGLFPVKKGSLIAYSGNRGGSQGPHLHFEIRRTADDTNLNPLLFGLPVPDNTPPVIQRLAIYDRARSLYEQSPQILAVHKAARGSAAAAGRSVAPAGRPAAVSGGGAPALYSLSAGRITVASPRVSFAISAFDTQSGSANPNGIFQATLYDNDGPLIGFQMDNISYNDTRNINAHIDYRTRATGGPFLQHLSRLPGYTSPSVYRAAGQSAAAPAGARPPADGVIDLGDGSLHTIRIQVKDAYGNTSELRYQVQYQASLPASPSLSGEGKRFYPGMLDGFETTDCAFYIGEKGLYDSVFINYKASGYPGIGISLPGAISAVHSIGTPFIPLQEPLLVRIRGGFAQVGAVQGGLASIGDRDRVVMVNFDGSRKDVIKPEWQGGWASGRFREFGNFQLVEDKEAPVITPIGIQEGALLNKAPRIAFIVKDNLGAIRNFRAELDGKWLCFTNDKGLAFIYKFDEHCPPGRHLLKVTVEDIAGNRTSKEYNFTR